MAKKKVTQLKKGQSKTSKAEMQLRIDEVKVLIAKGMRSTEIKRQMAIKHNVAE